MSLQESRSVPPSSFPTPASESRNRDSHAEPRPGRGTECSDDWFYAVAIAVFGDKETGGLLHLATGWPRTSCYAFVARDPDQRRKPSPEFLRILFRSEHGQPFHDAFMHGSTARWWLDRQRDARLAAASKRFIAEITD